MRRIIITFLLLIWPLNIAQAKRIALVIGNDNYINLPEHYQLKKAQNDARATAETFSKIGFEVTNGFDLNRRAINFKLATLAGKIEPGDEVMFFFAGHGVRIDGLNYLLPSDIPSIDQVDENILKAESIRVDEITRLFKRQGARLSILVLDACRNNPYQDNKTRSIGTTRGLAAMNPPSGTLVLFSAGAGQAALDRLSEGDKNPNSVFTRTFLPLVNQKGLELSRLARRVKSRVNDLAKTIGHTQIPAVYNEVIGDIYLSGKTAADNPASRSKTAEELLWETIAASREPDDFEFYLRKYPKGKFAALAELNLSKLRPKRQKLQTAVKAEARKEKPIEAGKETGKKQPDLTKKGVISHFGRNERLFSRFQLGESKKNQEKSKKTPQIPILKRSLDLVFKNYKKAQDFTLMPDGGYAITGGSESSTNSKTRSFILRLDKNGKTLWQKQYGGDHYNYANSIASLEDGGLAIASLRQKNKQPGRILIIRTDPDGNTVWEKELGDKLTQRPYDIIQLKDQGLAIVGKRNEKNNSSRGHLIIARLDKSGNQLWTYRDLSCLESAGYKITETSKNQIIVAGYCRSSKINNKWSLQIFIAAINNRGRLVWQQKIEEPGDSASVKEIIKTKKGTFTIFVDSTRGNWKYSVLRIIDINEKGKILNQNEIGDKQNSISTSGIAIDQNNNIYLAGRHVEKGYINSTKLTLLDQNRKIVKQDFIVKNNTKYAVSDYSRWETNNISAKQLLITPNGKLVFLGWLHKESYWHGLANLITIDPKSNGFTMTAR